MTSDTPNELVEREEMAILVAIDAGYILPFKVMAHSLVAHNQDFHVTFYVQHSSIPQDKLDKLAAFCQDMGAGMVDVRMGDELFADAPVSKRWPREMYYRLVAPLVLPQTLERILYLDSDMLIINSLRPLWETDLQGNAFAASSHSSWQEFTEDVNYVRLEIGHEYYNSGMILMDLVRAREIVKTEELFDCVEKLKMRLLMPDQDLFNVLYGKHTLPVDDAIWNYDVRYYAFYRTVNSPSKSPRRDYDWVLRNTAILHFCGSKKPWRRLGSSRFHALYRRYLAKVPH